MSHFFNFIIYFIYDLSLDERKLTRAKRETEHQKVIKRTFLIRYGIEPSSLEVSTVGGAMGAKPPLMGKGKLLF